MEPELRRQEILAAAFRQLAVRGFEGLRVRSIAQDAGIHHATLLHYFPTKEALIEGVIEELAARFRSGSAPPSEVRADPLEALRWEFTDARRRLRREPEAIAVTVELMLRARRDPLVAGLLARMFGGWRRQLEGIVRRGIGTGAFRADLDAGAVADALIAEVQGMSLLWLAGTPLERIDALAAIGGRTLEELLRP